MAAIQRLCRCRIDAWDWGVVATAHLVGATVLNVLLLTAVGCGGTGPPVDEFEAGLQRKLEETRSVAIRAADFDHDRTLRELGSDPGTGTLLRFDDHVGDATYQNSDESTRFPDAEIAVLDPKRNEPEEINANEEGLQSLKERLFDDELRLKNGQSLSYQAGVPIEGLGAVEMVIRAQSGERLQVAFHGDRDGESVTIDVQLVGDDQPRRYRIELAETLANWDSRRLARIGFRARARNDSSGPSLCGVRFLSVFSEYLDSDFGVTYRRHHGEMRRAVYQWSSSTLGFPVNIDREIDVTLELGGAVLNAGGPVPISVRWSIENKSVELLSAELAEDDEWTDWRIPLGKVQPGRYRMELQVKGDSPAVAFWSNPALVVSPAKPFNVIVVLEDALRADHLSCYGYDRLTTPTKDALVQKGVRFANCYAQATKTRFSCPSFMTSLYPTATGVAGIWNPHPRLHQNYITLAEVLRRRGFVTASFQQNPNAGSPAGLHRGFSYLVENVGGDAEDMYAGAPLRWIQDHRWRNFFVYLHVADPHEPYDPPAGFRGWFDDLESAMARSEPGAPRNRRDPQWVLEGRRALYDGEVRHNDYWFSVFLEKLSELGLERNTLIVFMADHGEHLGEHDLWSHNPPSYVQVLHTPLLMVCPDLVPANIVVDQNVQNLDIMPTVLDLAGVPTQGLLMQGTSLVPSFDGRDEFLEKRAVLAEEALLKTSREVSQPYGSVLFRQWHLLHSVYVQMRVFDLATDPMELSGKRPSRELRRNILQFLQDMQRAELDIWRNVTGGEVTDVALDPETVKELKALGYLE